MGKKKIMHIVQAPGGVERYILMLLNNMKSDEIENILVCSFDYKEETYNGLVTAFEYVEMKRSIDIKNDFKALIKIRRIIKKYSPDVVYMHSSKAGAIGRLANLGMKNTSLYNPHGWSFNMECGCFEKTAYRWIERFLARFCTKIIAISEYEKESALENRICRDSKIKVIFNGIDVQDSYRKSKKHTLTKRDLGIPDDAYVFGTVGRLAKQKAPDIFIDFASLIKKQIPKAYFIMVGDGDEISEIQAMIEREGLKESVLITGWVDDPMQYIPLFDQAFLLSRWEGFGLVLAEYMLAEKPIIATSVDAIPEVIENGVNGILVPPDDANSVYEAAQLLYKDDDYRMNIVLNQLKCVKLKFDISRVACETEALYKEICSSK
ncbi:glycosyltransferase family 4 protein [Gracilibacillus sp. Marseille-QA3620]